MKDEPRYLENRLKILRESIFGIWEDESKTMEVRVTPVGQFTFIKVVQAHDDAGIKIISHFCGLPTLPKRKIWKGFDLVTNLTRIDNLTFKRGIVHMPKQVRSTFVDLTAHENSTALLDFYFFEKIEGELVRRQVGSMAVVKVSSHA